MLTSITKVLSVLLLVFIIIKIVIKIKGFGRNIFVDEDEMLKIEKFSEKLRNAEEYRYEFYHPITNQCMERVVVGKENGKTIFYETMPNNGMITYTLSDELKNAIADYYVAFYRKEKFEVIINGKRIKNPLKEAMKNGCAVVTGYE